MLGWWRRADRAAADAAAAGRWVVVDVETTGLNVRRDRLLAIAAVAVGIDGDRASITLGDSFEVVLGPGEAAAAVQADHDNILLHGIGVGAQRAGVDPRLGLQAFARYVAGAPLLGFHVGFDQAVIERHARLHGLPSPAALWLDIEPLAAVLRRDVQARSLDEWMAALDIHCAVRHQAAADTLATAELLLKLWPRLAAEEPAAARGDARAALRLANNRHWLS
jgi:DNA polymerase III subunit epsilon